MKVSDSILAFLRAKYDERCGKDLLDFYFQHGTDLETQVNVAAGQGTPVPGKKSTFTDGLNDWWSIRIPKKADNEPEWKEYELKWPIELHADAIGSTGWNWQTKRSLYCGFDFDAIAGHAKGVGVTDDKLEEVKQAAMALPYVTVRRSTGGAGIHLYVFFEGEGLPTANHTEHAALARCVLGLMSAEAGFNFAAQIDACGGNMWFWSKKSTHENQGLALLKAGEPFRTDKLPPNWRDHVEVVTRKRSKVRVGGVDDKQFDTFEALASAHRVVPLGDDHKAHIDAIAKKGFTAIWIPDHNLLQTHTMGFKRLMMENKDEFELVGLYDTNSPGTDGVTVNCFAFPGDFGSWKIYRFGQGINEARTWEQDGQGWTTCWFNRKPNLKVAARALGGRDTKNGGFEFDTLKQAAEVVAALGEPIEVEPELARRKAVVNKTKDGRLTIEVPKTTEDAKTIGNWNSTDRKGSWTQIFDCPVEPNNSGEETTSDHKIRALKTPAGERAGWAVKEDRGEWSRTGAGDAKMVIQSFGNSKTEAELIMGVAIRKAWQLVSLPFQSEYPGDRQWNFNAPQLAFLPAEGEHSHWDRVLNHLGQSLTPALENLDWARAGNIRTGGDYLRAWYSLIIRDPYCRLPYLFFYGPENCGKSTSWVGFSQLVTQGVVKADRALTSQSDFNGELVGAIVCVVEEKDLSKTPGVSEKIKDSITSPVLAIREMRTNTYQIPNTTHWIQCSNKSEACIVPVGDTRITVFEVQPIAHEIPSDDLIPILRAEAPAFLKTLLDLPLPPVVTRLRLPMVETAAKRKCQAAAAKDDLIERICEKLPMGFKGTCTELVKKLGIADDPRTFGRRLSRLKKKMAAKGLHYRAGKKGDDREVELSWGNA